MVEEIVTELPAESVPDLAVILPLLEDIVNHLSQIETALGFIFGALLVLIFGGVLHD